MMINMYPFKGLRKPPTEIIKIPEDMKILYISPAQMTDVGLINAWRTAKEAQEEMLVKFQEEIVKADSAQIDFRKVDIYRICNRNKMRQCSHSPLAQLAIYMEEIYLEMQSRGMAGSSLHEINNHAGRATHPKKITVADFYRHIFKIPDGILIPSVRLNPQANAIFKVARI